jgi:hypothetical protein
MFVSDLQQVCGFLRVRGKKSAEKNVFFLGKNGRNLKPKKFVIYVPLRRNTTAEMARYSR